MHIYDLGSHRRAGTCSSPEAQVAFDQGLNWLYGFNHEAAIAAFFQTLSHDPHCGLALWGIAYAVGPNYNRPWEAYAPDERYASLLQAHEALGRAREIPAHLTPLETALLTALATRYPDDPATDDFTGYSDAYAAAMREVQFAFPDDLDVVALTAEALMNRTPWALWDLRTGAPAEGADTQAARAILETAFAEHPGAWAHPGCLHMYIHLMEMSPWPELALRHGDTLTELAAPEGGHLIHMASHIDVLCGDYHNVIARNRRAAEADSVYYRNEGGENFYTLYRLHNLHFECYGALFLAQPSVALRAADALRAELPDAVVRVYPDLFEAFVATRIEVMVRFGMWTEVLADPIPEDHDLYSFTTAMLRSARVVALANLGRIAEGEAEHRLFLADLAAIPESRMLFNNSARDVLRIAEAMAAGELAFKSGDHAAGLAHLRQAVRCDDGLLYEEPWAWMVPARHALGALLIEAGEWAEAESVYRADLGLDATLPRACCHPGNIWALHGLDECLARRGETQERPHIRAQLIRAQARAEVPVKASCFCRAIAPRL